MAMLDAGLMPGLVLCDYRMPGSNGLDVIRDIRRLLGGDIACILLTGDTGIQTMPDDLPNSAIMHKPVDVDTFFETLGTLTIAPVLSEAAS